MNVRKFRFSHFSAAIILSTGIVSALWAMLAMPPGTPPASGRGIAAAEELEVLPATVRPSVPDRYDYVEVVGGCGPYYEGGECVRTYSGAGEEYRKVDRLRKGVVLKVEPVLVGLREWYRIVFDEPVRYPERLARVQYVPSENVRRFYGDGIRELGPRGAASTTKEIIVDRSTQKLYAYDGDELFMEATISTGLQITPTPRGNFTVYKKTPTRYMQGPLPGVSDQYYDLPGVPWNLYFTREGGVIHGAYWHDKFGRTWSHGCVNVPLSEAQKLYEWADVGTHVLVRD